MAKFGQVWWLQRFGRALVCERGAGSIDAVQEIEFGWIQAAKAGPRRGDYSTGHWSSGIGASR